MGYDSSLSMGISSSVTSAVPYTADSMGKSSDYQQWQELRIPGGSVWDGLSINTGIKRGTAVASLFPRLSTAGMLQQLTTVNTQCI